MVSKCQLQTLGQACRGSCILDVNNPFLPVFHIQLQICSPEVKPHPIKTVYTCSDQLSCVWNELWDQKSTS